MTDDTYETRLQHIVAAMRQRFGERAYTVAAKQLEMAQLTESSVSPQWQQIVDHLRS